MAVGLFEPEELEQFIDGLHQETGDRPSMMLRYARKSGYAQRFTQFFDPFRYEEVAWTLANALPTDGALLATLCPKDRYSARFYAIRGADGRAVVPLDRKKLRRLSPIHPGYAGIRDPALEVEYQRSPGSRLLYEKSLVMAAATAFYRVLGRRRGGLYFMEKGWDSLYRLNPTSPRPEKQAVTAGCGL